MILGVCLLIILVHFPAEPTEYSNPPPQKKPPPNLQINWFQGYLPGELIPVPMKEWDIPPLRHIAARRAHGQFYFYIPLYYFNQSHQKIGGAYCPYKLSRLNVPLPCKKFLSKWMYIV